MRCVCGYMIDDNDKELLRCPKCLRLISFPSREFKKDEFDRYFEAAYEIMAEGVEGGCPFSGAR